MTQGKAGLLKPVLAVVGVAIGLWHAYGAAMGFFTASDQEAHSPLFWVAILCGPGSSLLAVLVGLVKPKPAGIWLISGGILSALAATLANPEPLETLLASVFLFAGPMAALGYGFLVLARRGQVGAVGTQPQVRT